LFILGARQSLLSTVHRDTNISADTWNGQEHAETPPGMESIAAESFAQEDFAYFMKVACGNDTVVPRGESSAPAILGRVPVCEKRAVLL
ncbi:unnamed protein product, partial [Symbiodinium sp. CCMP2456]